MGAVMLTTEKWQSKKYTVSIPNLLYFVQHLFSVLFRILKHVLICTIQHYFFYLTI